MDPITLAFASAVAAGAAQGMAGGPTAAAYQRLRDAILSRFGNDSTVVEAIEGVEVEPTSGAIEFLRQSLQGVAADQVPDLLSLAASLLELVGQRDVAGQHAVGRNIAQADRWSSAAVNINAKDQDH